MSCFRKSGQSSTSQVENRAKSPVHTEKLPGISLYPLQFHLQEIQLFVQCTLPTTSTESDFTLHVSIGGEPTCSSELANSPPGNPPESINTQPEISLEMIGCQPTPSPLVNALSKASLKITGGQPTASPEPEELAGGKRYLTRSQGAAPSFIKKICKGSTMYPLQ